MITLLLVAGIPIASAESIAESISRALRFGHAEDGLGLGRAEKPDEMMYADFARESFKHPKNRRDLHGYTSFDTRALKYDEGTCSVTRESCEYGLDPVTFAIWTKDAPKEAPEGSSQKNELVFALRGTPISTALQDLSPDDEGVVDIAVGQFTGCSRAKKALMTLRAIEKQFDGYRITITGHSLGGTTAMILLAQDAHNAIIETEPSTKASSIDAVYVYNAYRGGISGYFTKIVLKRPTMEPFYKLAFLDERLHGCFIFGDLLSKFTKLMAQDLMPKDRLYIGVVPDLLKRFPPLSWPFAHNMDGQNSTCRLTSPDYVFGDDPRDDPQDDPRDE